MKAMNDSYKSTYDVKIGILGQIIAEGYVEGWLDIDSQKYLGERFKDSK